jgi:tyrosyl-tRNA synthetase
MNLYDEYQWRGMIHEATPELKRVLAEEKLTAYIGFDPSAASLHVGSLLPVMGLARLQRFGHTPIAIAGGGTGLIGDPSGKTTERKLLTHKQVKENLEGIERQLSRFLDFKVTSNPARIINNAKWLGRKSLLTFMRDIGKHFTVNSLMAKEAVNRRFDSMDGISFTEFSYPLLQAYDYLELYNRYGCTLQMGGSDQWGNILAGVELIRKLEDRKVHGLVFPLVTTSDGFKFGKTEAGAIWLDAKLTSPYRFYQFWVNTDDRDVIKYLKFFTWLDHKHIAELEESVRTEAHTRIAQKKLAKEVTLLVHGKTALQRAERATKIFFGGEISGLSVQEILDIFADVPSTEMERSTLDGDTFTVGDALVIARLVLSKSEAKRLAQSGGVWLNNRRVTDARQAVTALDLIDNQLLVLRKGTKSYHLIKVKKY